MSDTAVSQSAPTPAAVPLATRDYRDPAGLTQWLKVLLIASFVGDLVAAGSGILELTFLQSLSNATVEGDINGLADANDTRQQAIGAAQFALYLVTAVVFLTWVHRANRNARALGAKDMRFTPAWAVGWYFVPIMSLWRPFQAMREIWQASVQPGNWQSVPTPPLVGWWWALFLGAQFLAQAGYQLSKDVDSVSGAMTASTLITISDFVYMPLDIVAMLLVTRIAAQQIWQAKTVEVF
jgi:hypothetical protein